MRKIFFCSFIFVFSISALSGANVSAEADKTRVYVGESITFTITMDFDGTVSDSPLFNDDLYRAEYVGRSTRTRHFSTISNNRTETTQETTYIDTYRIVPRSAGKITIPVLKVEGPGGTFETKQLTVEVQKPAYNENYHLVVKANKNEVYAGERTVILVTWYFSRTVRSPSFYIPFLNDDRGQITFNYLDARKGEERYLPMVNGKEVPALFGEETYNGQKYSYLRFEADAYFRKTMTMDPQESTVSFEGVKEYRQVRDFFNMPQNQPVYAQYVIPGRGEQIKVLDLPPYSGQFTFSGLVGEISLTVEASPTSVYVGEPITVTLILSGDVPPDYELPQLTSLAALQPDFTLPLDRSPGKTINGSRQFKQTIRVKNSKVNAVPSINLVYFNASNRQYWTLETALIPLNVTATETVDSGDLESGTSEHGGGGELTVETEGLLFNYLDRGVLRDQSPFFQSPRFLIGTLSVLILPPFLLVCGGLLRRKLRGTGKAVPAAKTIRAIKKIKTENLAEGVGILTALLDKYLRSLDAAGGYAGPRSELLKRLQNSGISGETTRTFGGIFELYERMQFGRNDSDGDLETLKSEASAAVRLCAGALG